MKSLNEIKEKKDNTSQNCKPASMNDYITDVKACFGLQSTVTELIPFINVDKPRLLTGETGVGKEWIARYIHGKSNRANGPFLPINMSVYSPDLLISELCGHEKGSYTSAHSKTVGLLQSAENGTAFLDEFNTISPMVQSKLLRIIEEKIIMRVGGSKPIKINCRVIIGSNVDLLDEVKRGKFRPDLYYRISTIKITIPPLRNRRVDIPILTNRIVSRIAKENGKHCPEISDKAMVLLITYDWPGNVRQLYNTLYYCTLICEDNMISDNHIIEAFKKDRIKMRSFKEAKANFEKEMIRAILLAEPNHNKSAKLLGIGRSTLRDKIRQYNIGAN